MLKTIKPGEVKITKSSSESCYTWSMDNM